MLEDTHVPAHHRPPHHVPGSSSEQTGFQLWNAGMQASEGDVWRRALVGEASHYDQQQLLSPHPCVWRLAPARSLLCSVPQTPNTVSENASLAKRAFTLLLQSVHVSVLGSGWVVTQQCVLRNDLAGVLLGEQSCGRLLEGGD